MKFKYVVRIEFEGMIMPYLPRMVDELMRITTKEPGDWTITDVSACQVHPD